MPENPFKKAIRSRKSDELEPQEESATVAQPTPPAPLPQRTESAPTSQSGHPEPKKRGRPATGKRSDDTWIGRTFYIQRETDFDIEAELLQLERSGFKLDKSELVEKLLAAWIKWRNGEDAKICLDGISPRQKD